MIDHVGFPVSDYERSKAFYTQAFAPLGYSLLMEVTGGEGGRTSPAAGFGKNGKPDFWIRDEGGIAGVVHVALIADTRKLVEEFYNAALAAGAKPKNPPRPIPQYDPNYYCASIWDPDGHNIEAACYAPA
jgi:catechol 2,3-dioxygenase-like lactoylglutathione lyase family enzyme